MTRERSRELFERARAVIPGGVNSPVRAFRSVSEEGPFFVERGEGAYLYDVDGNRYLDHVCSWGPLIFGHNPPGLAEALDRAVRRGTSYGAATALEVELAELIVELVPGIEQVRLVSSGTEATMSAIRLARGFTGRPLIVKCEGCYHGHADSFLVKAGSGGATFGVPDSAGVPAELSRLTLNVQYNAADAIGGAAAPGGRAGGRGDPRAGGGQHGSGAARAGLPAAGAGADPPVMGRCWSSMR